MSRSINLSLTDELRDLLRKKKKRMEMAAIRDAVLEGYQDALEERTVSFTGDIRDVIKAAKNL